MTGPVLGIIFGVLVVANALAVSSAIGIWGVLCFVCAGASIVAHSIEDLNRK